MAFRIEETDEPGLEHFGEMGADRVRETVRLRITADTLADLIQGVGEIPVKYTLVVPAEQRQSGGNVPPRIHVPNGFNPVRLGDGTWSVVFSCSYERDR